MVGEPACAATPGTTPRPCRGAGVGQPRTVRDPGIGAQPRRVSATADVILAAGPTIVAVVAIGGGIWQQKRAFSHEREMAELDATRAVLDEAAVALHDA